MKKLLLVFLVLVVLLLAAVAGATFFLGSIMKSGIETVGTKMTKVDVKLNSAKLSVLSGEGSLKGLSVANPPGFNSPSAIEVGEISVGVQPGSVFSDKVVVRSIQVISPTITLHGLKGDNLAKILENIQGSTPAGTADKKTQPKPAEGSGKKLEVDDFLLRDIKINLVLPVGGSVPLTLPEVHLTNLGKDSGGITGPELSAKVIQAVMDAAMASAGKVSVDPAKLGQDAGKAASKKVDNALKGVGNLLK
jgi:hypothetical protein